MSVKNDYDRFIAEQKEVMKKQLIPSIVTVLQQ